MQISLIFAMAESYTGSLFSMDDFPVTLGTSTSTPNENLP